MKTGQDAISICRLCSIKIPIGELRYHWQYGDFVCPNCFEGKIKKDEIEKVVLPNQEEKIDYLCRECGYKFSRNKNFIVTNLCFFCGKEGVVRADKKQIKVIKEINEDGVFNNSR